MELFKGVVVSIADDTKTGIIKCTVNGLYNSDSMGSIPEEHLPNVYPLYPFNQDDFDTPKKGQEVFILLDRNDKHSAFWFGRYKLSDAFKAKISEDYEGFKSIKHDEEEKLRCYFSRKEGLVLELDKARITIKDNEAKVFAGDRTVHVKKGMVSLGSEDKSAEPAVLGDKNVDALNDLCDKIDSIVTKLIAYSTAQASVATSAGYLAPLAVALTKLGTEMTVLKADVAKTKALVIPKTKSTKTSLD